MDIDIAAIKELIAALDESGVSRLKLDTETFTLSLDKAARAAAPAASAPAPAVQAAPGTAASSASAPAATAAPAAAAEDAPKGNIVVSPIVGTFYASSSPDKPAFVKVGQQVKKGDTLFIVESMKLMNEIASDFDGTVAEIYAANGSPLEYGERVMRIE